MSFGSTVEEGVGSLLRASAGPGEPFCVICESVSRHVVVGERMSAR